jgi:hypothetical protein
MRRAAEAEDLFRQARQAVDVLIEVGDQELGDRRDLSGIRKRLLDIALSYYQDFIDQGRGGAASQADLAAVQERVRRILQELEAIQGEMRLGLLWNPAVLDDLRLTPEQRTQLSALRDSWIDERAAGTDEPSKLDEEARRRQYVEQEVARERAIEGILTGTQRERLKQIAIQDRGLFAFKEPEIVKSLELTVEQRRAIRDIEREMFGPPPGPRHGPGRGPGAGPGDPRWRPPNLRRQESVPKALALLTDDQVRRWRDLTGEPFTNFEEPPFPGPRGFGPPGGGRRGGRRGEWRDDFPQDRQPRFPPPTRPDDPASR